MGKSKFELGFQFIILLISISTTCINPTELSLKHGSVSSKVNATATYQVDRGTFSFLPK